ncbi:hypothetical protein OEZ86_009777 [Tetradesmus obliquus]|uniref:Replication factor A protein 3 n=1 Tax=Tetradesmus obliquus TaxID=3088 RepID=A0ABY8UMQ1_TETOB|nr:hypothetical protein OEZ85_001219 [Tetradesmus obliquus]WIA43275.1 hypothetical protein OEZ86_009777 [Tetradesmus obliquus]
MNVDQPTPRVGLPQLKNYIGKTVIFVGKVETLQGQQVQMSAPDGSRVTIQAGNSTFDTQFVEVTGTVVDPMTIREESHVEFGEKFDLNLYNEFLKLSNGQYAELFYPAGFA